MKYTIEGFSQEYATTLKKEITTNGKTKQIKIDCTDLVILRWFVDFFPNMKKMSIDGEEYAWLSHKKLMEDMPILDISKRACIERMQKLVEFDILKYKLVKEGGTFSLYGFGGNYINLLRQNVDGIRSNNIGVERSNDTGGIRSNDIPAYVQPDNKDKSFITPLTNNNSISDKKESKGSFDRIIESYSNDPKIIDLLKEWLKVRKAKRAAMTDRAIQMNIAKLDELAQQSQMTVEKYLEEVICRGWAAFYPIKDYSNNNGQQKQTSNGNIFLDIAKEEGVF